MPGLRFGNKSIEFTPSSTVDPTTTNSSRSLRLYPRLLSRSLNDKNNHIKNVASLLNYSGDVRDLFLDAKVSKDVYALMTLYQCIITSKKSLEYLSGFKDIYIMPSSMWGRVKGQLDVAHYIAHSLKQDHFKHWKIHRSSFKLYWKIKKRAQSKKQKISRDDVEFKSTAKRFKTSTLIIDDMVTEGESINRLALSLGLDSCVFTLIDSKRL